MGIALGSTMVKEQRLFLPKYFKDSKSTHFRKTHMKSIQFERALIEANARIKVHSGDSFT